MIDDLTNPRNVAIDIIPEDQEGFKTALQKVQSQSSTNYQMLMRTKLQLHESQKESTDLKQ
jgi:hypothetical protein